jgi:methionine-rich copper-binding protein CopC
MRRQNHLLLLSIFCSLTNLGWAHAIVVESTPKVNDVILGPLLEIKLRFNMRIDDDGWRLTLVLHGGTSRPLELPQQASPDSLSATIPELAPGNYRLLWQVLAGDGHITQGDIAFTVAPH